MKWKQLLFALMIAVLCSSNAVAAEQSERTSLRNFRFPRSLFGGNEKSNVQRYQRLWFLKSSPLKPAINQIVNRYEPMTHIVGADHEMDVIDSFGNRKFEKIFALGRSMYIKPGFGMAPEKTIRNLGLEVGFRYLF